MFAQYVGLGVMQKLALVMTVVLPLASPAAAFTVRDDPLLKGRIGVWGTFSLFFLLCLLLSIICVSLSSTSGRRTPFALLLTASLLLSISALGNTALVVMHNIDSETSGLAIAAVAGIQSIASFQALALIFLAIAFVANERYERGEDAYMAHIQGKKHPLYLWGLVMFIIVFVMGSVAGGLWAWYLDAKLVELVGSFGRYNVFRNVVYAASSVYVVSGLFAIAQAVLAYQHMHSAGVSDRATQVLAFLVAPAYFCATVVTLSYNLVIHIVQNWPVYSFDRASLIFCVFVNFFIFLAVASLLILGMRKGDWYVWGGGSEAGKLSPASLNSKFDGPVTNAFVQPNPQQLPQTLSIYSTAPSPQPILQQQPQPQSIYSSPSSPQPILQPQYGPDGRPLSYLSTTSNGGNVRPETTYTYVGEVDSMLRRTAYGQAMQQQGTSPPPQPAGSPQPIAPQRTGPSPVEQFQAQHIQYAYR